MDTWRGLPVGRGGGIPLRVDGDLRGRVSRLGREAAPGYRFHGEVAMKRGSLADWRFISAAN